MTITVYKPLDSQAFNEELLTNAALASANDYAITPSDIKQILVSLLQTSLKPEKLINIFFEQIQHLMEVNNCEYKHSPDNIDVHYGIAAAHTIDYSLVLENQDLGNIGFSRKSRFKESELAQIENLLSTLIYPLRNAILYQRAIQQAQTDPLTGLGNRGALETAVGHQWQMAQRYQQHFCVLMLDIDHFKKINDTYGHSMGDKVLVVVADCIRNAIRQTDIAYRYGGEEFVILLTKSELQGAAVIAERIRESIASLEIPIETNSSENIHITISIGGANSSMHRNSQELMQQADKIMYHAKKTGRNRVELSK